MKQTLSSNRVSFYLFSTKTFSDEKYLNAWSLKGERLNAKDWFEFKQANKDKFYNKHLENTLKAMQEFKAYFSVDQFEGINLHGDDEWLDFLPSNYTQFYNRLCRDKSKYILHRYYQKNDLTEIGMLKNLSPNFPFWDEKGENFSQNQIDIFIEKDNLAPYFNKYDIYFNSSLELSFNFSDESLEYLINNYNHRINHTFTPKSQDEIQKELTHTKIQMILAQEIKSNLIIQKNTSGLNLFITKIKEYFNEKQIKIYWSDKYMKQLFIYSNQESNISKIALMHSIDIQTQKYTIYTYAKLNKLDLASIVTGEFVGIFLNYLFPTNFKALQEQYESIVYQLYTFKDDSPLAVIRDHFVTYPFAINSKFISFDLKKIFYGIDLCTGVFDTHFSFHYEIDQKLEENKEFLLKRLLSYLIIDEKRNATALEDIKEQKYIIDDYTFYFKELKSLELKKCTIYQLPCNHPLFKEFRNKEKQISAFKKDEDSPIHAYNEALQILQDFANGIYNTSKDKTGRYIEDKNKTRRLLEKLNIIGQNNLKAMYMGINENKESLKNKDNEEGNEEDIESVTKNKQSQKLPPNFIGRLATTIIIEDGLYMG
ncbi:hypothetical protein H9Y29_001940 [Campylobacter coli]|nr:hypothetical protein [Campylobacter coli]EAJ8503437.1 hypothetical protein [Campylobacter coli]EGC7427543.1 hypothetical protein [Campylobacter coli]